jgi:hypothetical protein
MLLTQDPVTLYGPNGKIKSIPAIDAPGWIAAGWSLEQSSADLADEAENIPTSIPTLDSPATNQRLRKKPLIAAQEDGDGNTLSEV